MMLRLLHQSQSRVRSNRSSIVPPRRQYHEHAKEALRGAELARESSLQLRSPQISEEDKLFFGLAVKPLLYVSLMHTKASCLLKQVAEGTPVTEEGDDLQEIHDFIDLCRKRDGGLESKEMYKKYDAYLAKRLKAV